MRADMGLDHMAMTYSHQLQQPQLPQLQQSQLQPHQVLLLVPTEPHSTAPGAHQMSYAMCGMPPMPLLQAPVQSGEAGISKKSMSLSGDFESQNFPDRAPTPRTELPTESDEEKEEHERQTLQAHGVTASTARRLRRKRAAERAKNVQAQQLSLPHQDDFRALLKEDPAKAIFQLKGQVWAWSRNEVGCRLVQDVLDLGTRDAAELTAELHGHVLEAVMCPHANYVIQKVVSHLSTAASAFVTQELCGNGIRVAKHRFACRIFCRLLEFCPSSSTGALVDELFTDLPSLCSHNFAHHVIESVLENGSSSQKSQVAKELLNQPWKYATHKNSSYIIEKALRHCDPSEQAALINKLGQPRLILDLARTQFGCYVARALLQESGVDTDAAMKLIQPHSSQLAQTTHGLRFLQDIGLAQEPQVVDAQYARAVPKQ